VAVSGALRIVCCVTSAVGSELFWAEDYQREIADLLDFDDLTHCLGRHF
jgi:hypothetical protein